jgi:formate dehydrogenase maturation protein FdhE
VADTQPPSSPRPTRSEPRELAELRKLRQEQPELASAVDLQIELIQLQRRAQSRVSLPAIKLEADYLKALLPSAPILRFEHLPIEWGDLRFLLRATASAMRSHEALEEAEFKRVEILARDADRLPIVVRSWYDSTRADSGPLEPEVNGLESVLLQAMRPFLTRSADAIMARSDLSSWSRGTCPLCGGDPDLAVITAAADRLLICGRCSARWRFDQLTCPFCMNNDRGRITSLASRDGMYRIFACDVCERYIKTFDARHAARPVMPVVDSVATLPFDAVAMQRGYK